MGYSKRLFFDGRDPVFLIHLCMISSSTEPCTYSTLNSFFLNREEDSAAHCKLLWHCQLLCWRDNHIYRNKFSGKKNRSSWSTGMLPSTRWGMVNSLCLPFWNIQEAQSENIWDSFAVTRFGLHFLVPIISQVLCRAPFLFFSYFNIFIGSLLK